jgi:ubiquinone/menaquinone biosynthesis C-methylase UbiE
MVQAPREDDALARGQAFDWWFATNFTGLYTFLLAAFWGHRHKKALPHIRGPRVLEVSFGMGYLLSHYAGKYETTGLDYNPKYIELARRRLDAANVKAELVEGDAHALPFADGSFETLINTDAFTLYADPQKAMSEFYRVLAPGGRLILMEYDYPKDPTVMGKLVMFWARSVLKMRYIDFRALLSSVGFTFEDHNVGGNGVLHMFVAEKPVARP